MHVQNQGVDLLCDMLLLAMRSLFSESSVEGPSQDSAHTVQGTVYNKNPMLQTAGQILFQEKWAGCRGADFRG